MKRLRNIPYKWLVAAVFISGLFMDLLDTTVVNVALPTVGRHFSVGNTTLEWVPNRLVPVRTSALPHP